MAPVDYNKNEPEGVIRERVYYAGKNSGYISHKRKS